MSFQKLDRRIDIIGYLTDRATTCQGVPDSVLGFVVQAVTWLTDTADNNQIPVSLIKRDRLKIQLLLDYFTGVTLFEKIERMGMTRETENFRVTLEDPGQSDIRWSIKVPGDR